MDKSWIGFAAFTLLAIWVQGIFALFEMACISFNRVRLNYFASLGQKRAIWLCELIENPTRLFGTTLIGINASLQIGSECSRQLYESLHLSPDFAPLSQVILVVLFGELIPLFSGRRHPERIAMALAPFMICISRILTPLIWFFSVLARSAQYLFGSKPQEADFFLSREELQKAFETGEKTPNELNSLASRVLKMKNSLARQAFAPIHASQLISSNASAADVRHQAGIRLAPFFLVYHKSIENIVAVAHIRDLFELDEKKRILDVAKPPWFVTQDTSLLEILEQFRRNNQSVALILDEEGKTKGVLSLDQIIDTLFGAQKLPLVEDSKKLIVERTIPGSMTIQQFNEEFQAAFPFDSEESISDLLVDHFAHPPVKGESVEIGDFMFTVLEPSLRGAKLVTVRTLSKL